MRFIVMIVQKLIEFYNIFNAIFKKILAELI